MVVIIGGGVFGLAIGWFLARANCPVTIFERGRVGREASWAAAGMLMPWKLSDSFSDELFALQQASYKNWPHFVTELAASTAIDIDYQVDGRYFVALSDKAVARFQRQFEFHRQIGFDVTWLSGDSARAREPQLGPKVLAAIFSAMGHRVDNRKLVLALRHAFLQAGGKLYERTPVDEILVERGQVRGVRLARQTLPAAAVILAAGAWSGKIAGLPAMLIDAVQPRKGQTLVLQMPAAEPLLRQPVLGPVYLVPRPDRRLIVGTTVEIEAGFDAQPTVQGVMSILNKAIDIVPAIETLPIVEIGAGLRPTGPEQLPVLGLTPAQGLIIASGGHSYGILLTPIVAQTISHLFFTGQTPDIIKPFTPQFI